MPELSGKTRKSYNGWEVPVELSPLNVELLFYREWRQGMTGHERAYHLRMAMWLAYPDIYGAKGEKWTERDDWLCWSWCQHRVTTVLGHTRASKTWNAAHIAVLDYMAAPDATITTLTTVTQDSLRDRLWSDVVASAKNIPGLKIVNYLFKIYPENASTMKYSITGFATSKDKSAAGKIIGLHAPRRRHITDEGQHTEPAVFEAMANMLSAPDFRGLIISNPEERASDYGYWAEPENGWSDERYANGGNGWPTKKGFYAIRYDGLKHVNVVTGQKIIPHSIDREFVEMIKRAYGENSVQFWSMVRGDFPPSGLVPKPFPLSVMEAGKRPVKFADGVPTIPCASLDPSHGGDDIVLTFARYGAIKKDYYAAEWLGNMKIQVDATKKDVSIDRQIALRVMEECDARNVHPRDFIMDTTGVGGLVYGWLLREWSIEIHSCEFGGSATDRPVMDGIPMKASELYQYFVTELWMAAAAFMQSGLFGGFGRPEAEQCVTELTGRRLMTASQNRSRVEPKGSWEEHGIKHKGFKDRLGYSPDEADSAVLIVELMRRKGGLAGHVQDWKTKPSEATAEIESRHDLLKADSEFCYSEPIEEEYAESDGY